MQSDIIRELHEKRYEAQIVGRLDADLEDIIKRVILDRELEFTKLFKDEDTDNIWFAEFEEMDNTEYILGIMIARNGVQMELKQKDAMNAMDTMKSQFDSDFKRVDQQYIRDDFKDMLDKFIEKNFGDDRSEQVQEVTEDTKQEQNEDEKERLIQILELVLNNDPSFKLIQVQKADIANNVGGLIERIDNGQQFLLAINFTTQPSKIITSMVVKEFEKGSTFDLQLGGKIISKVRNIPFNVNDITSAMDAMLSGIIRREDQVNKDRDVKTEGMDEAKKLAKNLRVFVSDMIESLNRDVMPKIERLSRASDDDTFEARIEAIDKEIGSNMSDFSNELTSVIREMEYTSNKLDYISPDLNARDWFKSALS